MAADPSAAPSSAAPSASGQAPRPIPVGWALVPVVALIAALALVLVALPRWEPGFEGSGHLPLVFAAVVAGLIARAHGHREADLQAGIGEAVSMALGAILILLVIGMLMGTWLAAGIVPALIDWGLGLLAPAWFLPATCAVCSAVSLVSGSSWSTAGTVGLALIGVGSAMGVDPAMTAGAVVSGAYFGDKLSPLSDTTNLAPAMAGAELFTHIRHMLYTTGPAWLIAMGLYTALGLGLAPAPAGGDVATIRALLQSEFHPGLVHLLPPAVVLGLVIRRVPALPSLLLGVALGGAVAILHQGASLGSVIRAAMAGYTGATGNAAVDELLTRGGMMSMGTTVFLILAAMAFGGVMERSGMLATLAAQLLRLATTTGSLIATTVITALGINVIAADQYISIVVPGRMYAAAYRERRLRPENLSRALEDGGTITSALVPWNTCGAFMAGTLQVATLAYAPYAFLNLLNPLVSIVLGYTGLTITRMPEPVAGEQLAGDAPAGPRRPATTAS
jgi:NhaC family Na+:H+ antiporter